MYHALFSKGASQLYVQFVIHSVLPRRQCFFYMIVQICLWKLTDKSNVLYSQVCAINAVVIILLGISMPSRVLQRALSYCFLIWSSLVILSKMIYQLRFVQADLFQHNCTDQVSQKIFQDKHFHEDMIVCFYKHFQLIN